MQTSLFKTKLCTKKCTYNVTLRHVHCRTKELQPSLGVSIDRVPGLSLFPSQTPHELTWGRNQVSEVKDRWPPPGPWCGLRFKKKVDHCTSATCYEDCAIALIRHTTVHHQQHLAFMELGHLLTRSGLTHSQFIRQLNYNEQGISCRTHDVYYLYMHILCF